MEGGNKTDINLAAGIDTSTSDMFVPFNGHTFQHNWQKFQGKFLPNSLRFEKNGWAAGWNVYNFKYNNTRIKLDDNIYAECGVYSDYAKVVTIYDSETSAKELAKYYIITDSKLLSGNATLSNNVITGELDGKQYELNWDVINHTVYTNNPLFKVNQTINSDKTITVVVSRTDSLNVDFNLYMCSVLTCTELSEVNLIEQNITGVTWGGYTYDFATNKISTPEGVDVDCTLVENKISFSYSKSISDEYVGLRLKIEPTYFVFNNVTLGVDDTTKGYFTNESANTSILFNRYNPSIAFKSDRYLIHVNGDKNMLELPSNVYRTDLPNAGWYWSSSIFSRDSYGFLHKNGLISCSSDYAEQHPEYNWRIYEYTWPHGSNKVLEEDGPVTFVITTNSELTLTKGYPANSIVAGNDYGTMITCAVPIWFSIKVKWDPIALSAKYMNNTKNGEIALYIGTGLNNKVTFINAYTGQSTVKNLPDAYSRTGAKPQFVTNIDYRFNQILVHNTIKPADNWSPFRYTVNKSDVWLLNEKQYSNFRNKNKSFIANIIGDLYELRDFTYKASNYITQNDVFNWEAADNLVYTEPDISDIPSVKSILDENITGGYADNDIIQSAMPPINELYDLYIAHCTDNTPHIYNSFIASAQVYDELYDVSGKYIGNTYTDISDKIDNTETFWPFKFVPQFSFKDTEGNVHKNCYWTDGTSYITDLVEFVSKVLGEFDGNLPKDNNVVIQNNSYSRERIVQVYSAIYDFNKPATAVDITKFNNAWEKYYPEIASPLDQFNDTMTADDDRYLNYVDISVQQNVTPTIKFVTPGIYVFNKFALPFSTSASVIMYDNAGKYTGDVTVYQQNNDVTDKFNCVAQHTFGSIMYNGNTVSLPYYFGVLTKTTLVATDNTDTLFRQTTASANLQSDNIQFSVIEKDTDTWAHEYSGRYTAGKLETVSESTRLNTFYKNIAFDINSGLVAAFCGYGYLKGNIIYPVAKGKSQLSDEGILKFNVASDDKIDASMRNYIWLDRSTINAYSEDVFTLNCASVSINEDSDNNITAEIAIRVESKDTSVLYYTDDSAKYYFPDVLFDEPGDNMILLKSSKKSTNFILKATPTAYDIVTDATPTFTVQNTLNSQHTFYTNTAKELSVSSNVQELTEFITNERLYVYFNSAVLTFNYNVVTKQLSLIDISSSIIDNQHSKLIIRDITGSGTDYKIRLDLQLFFNNCTAKFYYINDTDYMVKSADVSKVIINSKGTDITYNTDVLRITSPKVTQTVDILSDKHHIAATRKVDTTLNVCLPAVYNGRLNDNIVTFNFNNKEYSFDISRLSFDNNLTVLSTDIRDPDNTKVIGNINTSRQYQLVRQAWDTTINVENYWYVDPTHILELGLHNFKLKRNTGKLDDWNGNIFEDIYSIPRANILNTTIVKYFVPSVCNSDRSAIFITLQDNSSSISVSAYDIRNKLTLIGKFNIDIHKKEIGQKLNVSMPLANTAIFNTYSILTSSIVLATAEWSSTIVGNWLVIGCHVNNNFDQWTIVIDLSTFSITKVVQGYGFVGLHGDITGGMIPTDFMNESLGFTSTVQPLDSIHNNKLDIDNLDAAFEVNSIQELSYVKPMIIGTPERQWYIQGELHGIVSHLTFNDGEFEKQIIPITNKYTAVYKSGSFASSVIGDAMVQAATVESSFKIPEGPGLVAWRVIMAAMGWPSLYYLAPRYSTFCYLQQTLGQYAYVHYNSSESIEDNVKDETTGNVMEDAGGSGVIKTKKQADPILSSPITFDKQKVTQTLSDSASFVDTGIMAILIVALSEGLNIATNSLTAVNAEQSQNAISDIGKKYTPFVMESVSDMIATSIKTDSKSNNSMTSSVTAIKTLDMFYSTSDKQRVFAGPGFVEQQYVADCIAQSSTDLHVDGKVQQLFWCIDGLTTYHAKLALMIEKATAEKLEKLAEVASRGGSGTYHGVAAMVGAAAAMGGAMLAAAATVATEAAMNVLETLTKSLVTKGVTSTIAATVRNQNLTTEGTHKYGEKNEVFLWPCWGIQSGSLTYSDEVITGGVKNTPWELNLASRQYWTAKAFNFVNPILYVHQPKLSSNRADLTWMLTNVGAAGGYNATNYKANQDMIGDNVRAYYLQGSVPYYQAALLSEVEPRKLPNDMAKIEGVDRLLPNQPFRNDNCGAGDPVFAPSLIHDYIIDNRWDLGQTATYGLAQWITVKDTKITNCPPSNMYVTDEFCGVACQYAAIEVKRKISKAYMRPWAITPNTLAFNTTGYNTIFDNKLYHSFDGITYRLVDLVGSAGLNKNFQSFWYLFQNNDLLKRSNIAPANEILGNFDAEPTHAVTTIDPVFNQLNIGVKNKHNKTGTASEDRDATRWAIPIFTEPVSTLPAVVKTIASSPLAVVDGVTGLVTKLITDTNADYKAPLSIDFTIGKKVYRATEEYICSVTASDGGNTYEDIVPILGLMFIGSTPTEAYFYSKATRYYYTFTGNNLVKVDMLERFRDIQRGYWDFVNQEVVMPCLMTFKRLNPDVKDKDTETDNIIVPVLQNSNVSGELPPPLTTIFNDKSWYKAVSLPSGFAYQGPNRVIINRSVLVEYMTDSIRNNFGKWGKLNKEKYSTTRDYFEKYTSVTKDVEGVDGWTYNPFVLVTSPLGQSEDSDGLFEWSITFCWPIEMDLLYGVDNYAVVNIAADTMTVGSKIEGRPTHVYLTKELFARADSYGYYTFTYQSKNGIGNRERLRIWSDQYIAISSISCEFKSTTTRRATILTQQLDTQLLKEL